MPRQTRRARSQASAQRKGAEPVVPRHFYRREPAAAVEAPAEPDRESEAAGSALESDPAYLRPAEPARLATAAPRPAPRGIARAAVASKERLASTDYGYVVGELKRIFLTAALIIAFLIVVALIKR